MADSLSDVVVELQKQITCPNPCVRNFAPYANEGGEDARADTSIKQRTRIGLSAFER